MTSVAFGRPPRAPMRHGVHCAAGVRSGVRSGPVGELLDASVKRPAFNQLEVEVSCTVEDRVIAGPAGDYREDGELDAIHQAGRHQGLVHR